VSNQLIVNWMSGDWIETQRWATEELEGKRAKLETILDHDTTQMLRGEIKVLKNLLAQPDMAAQEQQGASPDWD
jgi:hypothetical protein